MPKQLVCDTVVLSNFALAGALEVLAQRYGKSLICTHEVLAEMFSAGRTWNSRGPLGATETVATRVVTPPAYPPGRFHTRAAQSA